jgi:G patch domain-containing protein 1
VKPFKDQPAKQERFERFLKEKYQGGLRSTESSGSSNMSEAARARERLDFEAAAEAIAKGHWGKESKHSTQQFMEFPATGGMQFTSGGVEVCFRLLNIRFFIYIFYFVASDSIY